MKKSDKSREFYVTHYIIGEPLPKTPGSLRNIEFVTADTANNPPYFFHGLDTSRRFPDVSEDMRQGAIRALPKPSRIETSEGVWMDERGDVWIADFNNPLGDKNRRKVS
jgi:hypothetical protein